MKNKLKVLQLLGLARRAGKLTTGDENVLKKVRTQKTYFVFVASDCSEATLKKYTDKCQSYHITMNSSFTQVELSNAIGIQRKIVSVDDSGFSRKFTLLLE
ncbi:L7Ae/L30e/S12e/Gadd45 family ribosomal protein [Liquorilactobacillus uvarum]|uniref:L7Ae/L30e/S12e/Gadd45 family ribosomal protein n=1 Tax=Liquorilactobacillus uvarum TaxID=303240 RepID=UPI00288B037A|nr:ribosomal L7Ae/L30e/S12e/Gadd45 family protein [Liquorilactobacillus uvarum]